MIVCHDIQHNDTQGNDTRPERVKATRREPKGVMSVIVLHVHARPHQELKTKFRLNPVGLSLLMTQHNN